MNWKEILTDAIILILVVIWLASIIVWVFGSFVGYGAKHCEPVKECKYENDYKFMRERLCSGKSTTIDCNVSKLVVEVNK